MAEKPKLRFKSDNGSKYPDLWNGTMRDYYTERNEHGADGLPVLTVSIHSGVSNGELDENELGKRVKRSKDLSLYKKAISGDLVFNMMRAWQGAVGSVETTGIVSPAYIVAKPNAKIDPYFMNYYVQTKNIIDRFNRLSYGALDFRKRLYWESFVDVEVNIPCIEEQRKIADFLSSVDEVITASEQEVANLEIQKKAVMKKIFSREVRFKRADGSDFPEWEDIQISDMLTICHGRDYKHLGEGNIPVMGTGGVITYVDEALCDWECVCIGRKGTIDRPYYMNEPFWSVDTLFYTKPKDGFLPKYQFYVFQNIDWKFYNEATGVPSLSASTIEKIGLSVASLEEQRLIADFLSNFDEAIVAAKKELELWKELKKGLLQQMFV